MRIGVVSDIHANLVALEAVLADLGPVDALWVCGDTVGYGPDPSDVLALLVERKVTLLAGNHDRAVATGEDLELFNPPAAAAAKMHQRWLSAAERDMLAALPRTLETSDVTLCHGSLRDPLWEYDESEERRRIARPREDLALLRRPHARAVALSGREPTAAGARGLRHAVSARAPRVPEPGQRRSAARRGSPRRICGDRPCGRDRHISSFGVSVR